MQYDADTPAAYLAALDDDWRKARIEALRAVLARLAPEWREGIEYGMLAYFDEAGAALHLNAQKAFVGIYVGDVSKVDPRGELLEGLNLGKGCIRLKRRDTLEDMRIVEALGRLIELRRAGADTGC